MQIDLLDSAGAAPAPDCFMVDRAAAAEALALVDRFGVRAGLHAAERAEESRARGNVTCFCRWRQIERLIGAMQGFGSTRH